MVLSDSLGGLFPHSGGAPDLVQEKEMAVTVLHQIGTHPDAESIQQVLRQFVSPAIATHSIRFFKTGPGEYGEGDQFLGVHLPACSAECCLALNTHRLGPFVQYCNPAQVLRSRLRVNRDKLTF